MYLLDKLVFSVIGLSILFTASTLTVYAQVGDAELEQRVFNLGFLRTGKSSSKSKKKEADPKATLAQIQADFTAIQVTNNDLAELIEREKRLDLEVVSKAVTEIRTSSIRLMENLTESKTNIKESDGAEIAKDQTQLKEQLSMLDKLIVEFTHNRVFKEESPDDSKLATKALTDLDQIIRVSTRIVESLDNLKKSN